MLGARLAFRRSLAPCSRSRALMVANTCNPGSASASTLQSSILAPSSSCTATPMLVRTMASKKNKKKGGGNNNKMPPIEFMVEGLDQMYEECKATDFNQVMKSVAKAYNVMPGELSNGSLTMQLGNDYGDWEDLTSFQQLKEACKGEDDYGGPAIRIKELADEEEDDDLDEYGEELLDEDKDYPWDENKQMTGGGNGEMKEIVNELVEALKEDGWRLDESKEMPSLDEFKLRKENDGEEMPARVLVVKYAKVLPDLQDQLIVKIGALDHIVQCLQFGFLWESDEKKPEESEESRDEDHH